MDPLVAAGAECYELVVARQPSWSPSIPEIRPHVHAKTMSVDGKVCAVGSANLDVTATYWEDELMLLVEDPGVATAVEDRFDQLMAGSARVDRTDPAWKRRAEQRRWMRHWPGVLG
jgi:phosphatidylserine/phosphatidylglycerophosphate/cardiolipin synthase-like enzyme